MNRVNPLSKYLGKISEAKVFMLMLLFVNGGNYLYNLLLGHLLGPEKFAHAAFLITMLLSLSFIAMTFQLLIAKFYVELDDKEQLAFMSRWSKNSVIVGVLIGVLTYICGDWISYNFQLDDSDAIRLFALGMPLYFLFNVQRGCLQAQEKFIKLGYNYLLEMLVRLSGTICLILLFPDSTTFAVSLGILLSILASSYIVDVRLILTNIKSTMTKIEKKKIYHFAAITLLYELTLNLINSADIIVVKQNFESTEAGLYASIALVGRMVYYITWMYAMILLPGVVRLRKEGKNINPLLMSTLRQVGLISAFVIVLSFLFPETIVKLLFGEAYVSQAHLLGIYALATGVFCMSNIFSYTYLSLSNYTPIVMTAIVAVIQVIGLSMIEGALSSIVWLQVFCMSVLLVFQIFYHFRHVQILSSIGINHPPIAISTQTK
jgi:O-antigen/teichoic acid export membrane protein